MGMGIAECKSCGTDMEVEKEVFSMDKLFTGHSCRGRMLRCSRCEGEFSESECRRWRAEVTSIFHARRMTPDYDVIPEVQCPKCDSLELCVIE